MQSDVDNEGSIKMAKNDTSGDRTKHIDMKYHSVRKLLQENQFEFKYCPGTEVTVDFLTKPLGPQLFHKFRIELGIKLN